MTVCWRGNSLWITSLPIDAMGRLASCAPRERAELEVWAALLAGARVCVPREALVYRAYRKSAPIGVYRKCVALERELREMGLIVVRNGGRKSLGNKKGGPSGGTDLFVGPPDPK